MNVCGAIGVHYEELSDLSMSRIQRLIANPNIRYEREVHSLAAIIPCPVVNVCGAIGVYYEELSDLSMSEYSD